MKIVIIPNSQFVFWLNILLCIYITIAPTNIFSQSSNPDNAEPVDLQDYLILEKINDLFKNYERYLFDKRDEGKGNFINLFDQGVKVFADYSKTKKEVKKKISCSSYWENFQDSPLPQIKVEIESKIKVYIKDKNYYLITLKKPTSWSDEIKTKQEFLLRWDPSLYRFLINKVKLIGFVSDVDNDGFDNDIDDCPGENPGSAKGCPDQDLDNIADKYDNCDFEPGIIYENEQFSPFDGCPDKDNDEVPDKIEKDSCRDIPGAIFYGKYVTWCGCPDTNKNKIPDLLEPETFVTPKNERNTYWFYKEDGTINIPEVIGDSKKLEELIDTINAYENRKQLDEFDFQVYKDYGKAIFTAINQDRKDKGMPTLETSNETALIPGGAFIFGDAKNKNKSISLEVSEFLAVTILITNEDYANFLNSYQGQYKSKSKKFKSRKESGRTGNKLMLRLNPTYFDIKEIQEDSFVVIAKKGTAEEPITQVTWFGAYEFARHYGLWLPTEVQWEYLSKTYKEDEVRFPVGYSEWCQDKYSKGAIKDWKSKKKTQRDPEYPGDIDDRKVLRSSAYKARNFSLPESTDTNISFRCVVRTNTIGQ